MKKWVLPVFALIAVAMTMSFLAIATANVMSGSPRPLDPLSGYLLTSVGSNVATDTYTATTRMENAFEMSALGTNGKDGTQMASADQTKAATRMNKIEWLTISNIDVGTLLETAGTTTPVDESGAILLVHWRDALTYGGPVTKFPSRSPSAEVCANYFAFERSGHLRV